MEKMARVLLKNGNWKYFYGDKAESEANAYEVEMKQQEIEEQERQKKAEAERKVKEAKKLELVNQIKKSSNELHSLLKQYEDQEGRSFTYYDKDFKDINLTRLINGLFNGLWNC